MSSTGISNREVEYEGPASGYDILVVGESPGEWEDRLGRPFVSVPVAKEAGFSIENDTAGDLLERYLGRLGVSRSSVKLANLCNFRPPNNSFEALLGSSQLVDGLGKLKEEIQTNKPNVVLALGNWPMYFLAGKCGREKGKEKPGTGILTLRGSRYRALEEYSGPNHTQKIFPTMHPAYVLRNWMMNPIFFLDLGHAIEDSAFPELGYPNYDEHIDPPLDILYDLIHEALSSNWISVDIETFPGGRYSCVGFSYQRDNRDVGVCLTCLRKDITEIYAREIWESDTPKIFQYGTYDIAFMKKFYGWKVGGYYDKIGWDTFVASASLLPDYPRGLDFLTSIYTRFPFYKHERKTWKESMDLNILWRYNIKDCIATYQIAMKQMEGIKELFPA